MKTIALTQGKVALVDDEDFELISRFRWHAFKDYNVFYARRTAPARERPGKNYYSMHREIINAPNGVNVDHIDGNGLNNQKANLRLCTQSQNMANRIRLNSNNTSGFRGVSFHKKTGKFRARIRFRMELIELGEFTDKDSASVAYENAAKEYFGDFFSKKNRP